MTPTDITDWFPAAIGAILILLVAGCVLFLFWNLWQLAKMDKRK